MKKKLFQCGFGVKNKIEIYPKPALGEVKVFLAACAFVVLGSMIFVFAAEAAAISDAQSGNWSDTATWTGGVVPVAGDDVTIDSGTVTLTADAACDDITVSTGGNFNAGAYTITVSGNWNSSAVAITYGTSTVKMTGLTKTFQTKGAAAKAWNLTIGDGTNAASVSYSAAAWYNVVENDLAVANNATLTITGGFYIYLPATGDITVNAGATLNINNPGVLTRSITDSSSHINSTLPDPTVGTITGTATFEYFVEAGNTNAPVTARTYGCNLAVAGAQNAVGVLGGGTSLNLGAKTLYLYDVNTNNDQYGILDNSGNIPVTAATLQVGSLPGSQWYTGKLIARGAVYTFTNVNVYSLSAPSSPTIDCLTGGGSSTWNVSGNVTIYGTYANKGVITAGASTWNVGGNWANSGTFTAGTSTITFNGSGTQTLNSGGSNFYNLTINSSGTVQLNTNNLTQNLDGVLTMTAGTLNLNAKTLTLGANLNQTAGIIAIGTGTLNGATNSKNVAVRAGSTMTQGTGTLSAVNFNLIGGAIYTCSGNSVINVSGGLLFGDATFTASTSTITVSGTGKNFTTGAGHSLNNLTVSGSYTLLDALVVGGNLIISAGGILTANASTITVGNWWNNSGTFTGGTSTVIFNKSSGDQYLDAYGSGANNFFNLTHSGAARLIVRETGTYMLTVGGALTNSAGILNFNNWANVNLTVAGLTTISGGTCQFAGSPNSFNGGLTVSGGTFGGGSTIDINGNFTFSSGTVNAGVANLNLSGDLAISSGATWTKGTSTLTFDGGATQNFTDNNSVKQDLGAVVVTGASTNLSLQTALSCTDLTIQSNGALTTGNNNLTISGNWVNSSTFTAGTSTINFTKSSGTQTLTSGGTGTGKLFYNLTHSGAGTLSIITNDAQIDGALDNTAGAIAETSGDIIHSATSLKLTDSGGTEVSEYVIGTDTVYARLVDEDENLNASSADTSSVTVSGNTNGDSETITLTETGNATEIFMSSGLTTAAYDGSKTNNDGTLELSHGETITVRYTDSEDASDNALSDTAQSRLPTANFLVTVSSPQTAGKSFTMTITARNANNTTDTTYSGTANITLTYSSPTSGTKTLSVASASSWASGIATVTQRYDDAGTITITATDASNSSIYGTSNETTFIPENFTLAASKSAAVVNEPITLTITAKDYNGNTTPNYKGLSALSINYVTPSTSQSGSLSISTLAASNWSSGIAALSSFTYNKFGIITITCKDPTDTSKTGTSSQLTFLPLKLEVSLASPGGGRNFYYAGEDIVTTVIAKDYNNSVVSNYAGTVGFSGEEYLDLPANYAFTSSDSGTHIFSGISSVSKGTTSITATDTTYSSATGTSSEFKIKEGTIRVMDTSGPVQALPVTIKLIDSEGNDITNDSSTKFSVTLSESNKDNTATSPATKNEVIFENGTAEIEVTDTQAEVVTVTPVSENYLEVLSGKVTFGGVATPRFGPGMRVLFWRELRSNEAP